MNFQNVIGATKPVVYQDVDNASVFFSNAWFAHCRPLRKAGPVTLERHRAVARAHGLAEGVAHLAALMLNDLYQPVSRQDVFAPGGRGTSVNLIDAPLMLTTLYGRTGAAESFVYCDHDSAKFELFLSEGEVEDERIPSVLRDPRQGQNRPALADKRNGDTPVLTQIALEFMRFHNRRVDQLRKQGVREENVFALARAATMRTWHNILRSELLNVTCRPAELPAKLQQKRFAALRKALRGTAFASFRALHTGEHAAQEAVNASGATAFRSGDECNRPRGKAVDIHMPVWAQYFDAPGDSDQKATHRTGFTPSVGTGAGTWADTMNVRVSASALDAAGLPLGCAVEALKSDVCAVLGRSTAPDLQDIPAVVVILAEGHYDKTTRDADLGKLGSLGSALVRDGVFEIVRKAKRRIDGVVRDLDGGQCVPLAKDLPKTFCEMIAY